METPRPDPLSTAPPALTERQRTVTLSDGKTVIVEKWGWRKLWELARCTGDPDKIPHIARESVRAEDREMVDALPMEDQLAIAAAAADLNLKGETGPNLLTLARAWGRLSQGLKEEDGTPSNPN